MENALLAFILIIVLAAVIYFGRKSTNGSEGRQRSDNDARRFARLLITEIKLYENYKLQKGLKNNNLYESLGDEIEAARKMYEKRFPGREFERLFEIQLLEVLAGGDKSKLGLINTSLNE